MPSSQPSYLIATIEAQSCTKLSAGIYTNRIESDFVPPHGVLKLIKGIITLKTSYQPQILLHQVPTPTNQSSPQINRYLIVLNELIELFVFVKRFETKLV